MEIYKLNAAYLINGNYSGYLLPDKPEIMLKNGEMVRARDISSNGSPLTIFENHEEIQFVKAKYVTEETYRKTMPDFITLSYQASGSLMAVNQRVEEFLKSNGIDYSSIPIRIDNVEDQATYKLVDFPKLEIDLIDREETPGFMGKLTWEFPNMSFKEGYESVKLRPDSTINNGIYRMNEIPAHLICNELLKQDLSSKFYGLIFKKFETSAG